MDFLQDALADGRRFRTLNILDLATRERLTIKAETSLPGPRVLRVLDQAIGWYGVPKRITLDNGPEFAGRVLDAWVYAHQIILDFIEPGTPTQNGHLERFNGKFRDEYLNLQWFTSLHLARQILAAWKEDYDTQRPHSALHQQPAATSHLCSNTARLTSFSESVVTHRGVVNITPAVSIPAHP